MEGNMAKYRIGIVGSGGIARRHIEGYRAVAGDICEVVAACDVNQKTLDDFCRAYNVPLKFTDTKDLIESGEVDVISLLTPPAVRHQVIFPAFEHGIHMLVEKPFAEKMSDAVSFVEAAEKAGVVLAVNQQIRLMPDILKAKEIIESGEIGDVRFVAHDHFQNRTRTRGWRKDEKRLEISIFSIHVLDRIRWLAGRLPEAVAATTRYWDENVQGETFTALTIQFADGVMGTMVSNWHSITIPECRLRIDGAEGSLLSVKKSLIADQCMLTVHPLAGEARQQDCSRRDNFTLAMGDSMKRLLQAASAGTQPVHSGRDNLETMAIVDAAYLSASRGGERVSIDEVWRK
jgi:predicted dehydrogenase